MSGAPDADEGAMNDAGASRAAARRVLVWGAGAIGGTVAAYLRRAGLGVTAVDANREHVRAVSESGLHITGPIDSFTQPLAMLLPESVEGVWDIALLCTKALDTEAAARQLAPHLAGAGVAVSLQNGLNEMTIAEILGRERTMGGFVNFGADVVRPGVIQFGGRGAVVVGELDGRDSERLEEVRRLLRHFEPTAASTDNIWGYLWGKMGYGAMLFAEALTDASIVETLGDPGVQPVLTALAREVMEVAAAHGARPVGFNGFDPAAFVPGADPAAARASFDAMVAFNRRSAKTHSGVWRDLAVHHRKTETDAQFVPILRIAAAHGLAVPHLRRLVELMHAVEDGELPRAWENLAALGTNLPEGDDRAPAL